MRKAYIILADRIALKGKQCWFLRKALQHNSVLLFEPGPQGYKTFFMLNSAEHGILSAHKSKNNPNKLKFQV